MPSFIQKEVFYYNRIVYFYCWEVYIILLKIRLSWERVFIMYASIYLILGIAAMLVSMLFYRKVYR